MSEDTTQSAVAQTALAALKDFRKTLKDFQDRLDISERRDRIRGILWVIITSLVIGLAVVTGISVSLLINQSDATAQNMQQTQQLEIQQQRQHGQAVASCQIGNDRAAGTVAAIDELITLLEGKHPTPAIRKIAAKYEAFVLAHNAPRNCQAAYKQ